MRDERDESRPIPFQGRRTPTRDTRRSSAEQEEKEGEKGGKGETADGIDVRTEPEYISTPIKDR